MHLGARRETEAWPGGAGFPGKPVRKRVQGVKGSPSSAREPSAQAAGHRVGGLSLRSPGVAWGWFYWTSVLFCSMTLATKCHLRGLTVNTSEQEIALLLC